MIVAVQVNRVIGPGEDMQPFPCPAARLYSTYKP